MPTSRPARETIKRTIIRLILTRTSETGRELTIRDLVTQTGYPYSTVRDALNDLVKQGKAARRIEMRMFGEKLAFRIGLYRWILERLPPPPRRLYRTMKARIYYTNVPRRHTPDPIAEFRVTVISMDKNKWRPELFQGVFNHIGLILTPGRRMNLSGTYWDALPFMDREEYNEEIDLNEIEDSVPAFKVLDVCERHALFYTSRKDNGVKLREQVPNWWDMTGEQLEKYLIGAYGDYEYGECMIKLREKIVGDFSLEARMRGEKPIIRWKFDNDTGQITIPLDRSTPYEFRCDEIQKYKTFGVVAKGRLIK